jgi:hypothetical protein
MTNYWLRWVLLAVAVAVSGFWYWQAPGDPVQVLAALTLAVTAGVGALWQSRVQAARRLRTALDTYVERDLARERRRKRKTPSIARIPAMIDGRAEPVSSRSMP